MIGYDNKNIYNNKDNNNNKSGFHRKDSVVVENHEEVELNVSDDLTLCCVV